MKVLVPYDGSKFSQSVLRLVATMSLEANSEIFVLNVIPSVADLLPFDLIEEDPHAQREQSRQIAGICRELAGWQPNCRISHRVLFGQPIPMILDTAHKWLPDLVIMGSHGRKGLDRLILGSVSQAVLEHADCPVMVVKPEKQPRSLSQTAGLRILVPLDGSVYSFDTVEWLANQYWKQGTSFRLLNTIPEFPVDKPEYPNADEIRGAQWNHIKESSFQMMEEQALKLGAIVGNSQVSLDTIPGDPRHGILDEASRWNADVIALGSHGRTGVEKLLAGSVSMHIAVNFDGAVVVVKRLTSLGVRLEERINKKKYNSMKKAMKEARYNSRETGHGPILSFKP